MDEDSRFNDCWAAVFARCSICATSVTRPSSSTVTYLRADGGTRVANMLAGYAALFDFSDRLIKRGTLSEWPLTHELGAVSVGYVGGERRVDLDYAEDAGASADLNVVATAAGLMLEAQGGLRRV